jgi:pilus assembly protein FimV
MAIRYPVITVLLALLCANAYALALSDATVHSHLGEPLAVSLAVSDSQPLVAQQVRVRFGTPEEYASAGMDRNDMPRDATLTVEQAGKELRVLISTENSVAQPFIDFLLVVESPQARLERQYTLLLDLPR